VQPEEVDSVMLKNIILLSVGFVLLVLFNNCSGSFSTLLGGDDGGQNQVSAVAERLSLSGDQILDPNGNAIQLRGFNWGNWGTAQPQDAADHVKQGANTVRLLLRWWGNYAVSTIDARLEGPDVVAHVDPAHIARLDTEIEWATSQGLWVDLVIDSNCGQNGMQDSDMTKYCDPNGQYGSAGHNFWTDPQMRQEFVELWQYVAARYKGKTRIAMYEILPEPFPPAASQADVTEFYKELIRAVRGVDDTTPFLIGATNAYNIRDAENAYLPDAEFKDKIIYTGDLFVHTNNDQQTNINDLSDRLQGLLKTRTDHNVPIFVQQTGAKSGEDPQQIYINAVLSLLRTNSVPFTVWQYRDHTPDPNGYGVNYPATADQASWISKPDLLSAIEKYFH
jgi:hypothetical protein